MFNKKDLEGKFVVLRNGRRGIIINSHIKGRDGGIDSLENYNKELKNKCGSDFDIKKIFKIKPIMGLSQLFSEPEECTELIWVRKEIDWNNVPKYTKVQVRDDETGKWYNRYFIDYEEGEEYPFVCSSYKEDEFTNAMPSGMTYKYCRLYKED